MIELLKYLAANLTAKQLIEVAHIISRNPNMIDHETLMHIVDDLEDQSYRDENMEKAVDNAVDRIMENNIDSVGEDATANNTLKSLLKDLDISLN